MDLLDKPTTTMEIIGRGAQSRKSKTFIKDQELATLLGFIQGHTRRMIELFRLVHARHHNIDIEIEKDDGTKEIRTVPHVLSDDEVRERYPVTYEWERMHQEQVDHYASIGGFSVRAASGMRDDLEQSAKAQSSAGADRRSKTGATEVAGTEPRWR